MKNSFCNCAECREIHAEFIEAFGHWPDMSHAEGQELKRRREENLASWERVTRRG